MAPSPYDQAHRSGSRRRRPSAPPDETHSTSCISCIPSMPSMCLPRLPSKFNIFRTGIYLLILLWALVCLAIAAHFQSVLVASDLTHFVPFAIFVSSATMVIILVLLGTTFLRQRNPISARIELSALGLAGVLWLALAVFLSISQSAQADVECFSSDSTQEEAVESPGFSTEIYHAQYHVLQAFSIFNVILVWGFLLFLLFLALLQHRRGYNYVWTYPVPIYPWFDQDKARRNASVSRGRRKYDLPAPVTQRPSGPSRRGTTQSRKSEKESDPKAGAGNSSYWVWVDKPEAVHAREHRRERSTRRPTNAAPRR